MLAAVLAPAVVGAGLFAAFGERAGGRDHTGYSGRVIGPNGDLGGIITIMPTRSDGGILLKRLRTAVEHLAWPPARQKEYLSELGVAPLTDELALEFDDIYHVAMAQFGELGLASRARESLLAIDQMLTNMSAAETESAMIWQFEGLDRAESWEEVRKLAGHLLEELPRGLQPS